MLFPTFDNNHPNILTVVKLFHFGFYLHLLKTDVVDHLSIRHLQVFGGMSTEYLAHF